MLDWHAVVRQRLSGLALDAAEKDEVHVELAAHLEESYEALRAQGVPEPSAIRDTLSQVSSWTDLQAKILSVRRRRQPMRKRAHQLWIPGFLTLALSTIFLMTLQKLGFQPRVISWMGPGTILLYVPWLAF